MEIIKPGKNCERLEHAHRAALLIDAQEYFSAFHAAVSRAKRQVLIAGWDVDSRVRLLRGKKAHSQHDTLSGLLDGVAAVNPDLDVYVLVWDFAMIYAMEREPLPVFKLGWKTHKRVHFHMDDEHPLGASHHQKIVVVDDKLAFVGGLDLTKHRWDTRKHLPDAPLRVAPQGEPYGPFHDVQMVVDGDIARALGDQVRTRWRRATGDVVEPPDAVPGDPWPNEVQPQITDVRVALALTDPAFKGRPEVRQVEELYVDAILAAKECIYIENQYFTSHRIAAALAARLREGGVEIVMVQPKNATGWLEENTMGAIRAKLLHRLKEEDKNGRLRVYHAVSGKEHIKIHGKVMVVDDSFMRVGSANLSNRSMGLDTECDLAVEAESDEQRNVITAFRDDLVAEHLGASQEEVAKAVHKHGSLAGAVESLRGGARTLEPLEPESMDWAESVDVDAFDPEKPVKIDRMIDEFMGEIDGGPPRGWIRYVAAAMLVAALILTWRFTELGQALDADLVASWIESARLSPLAPVYVVLGFIAASVAFFPITVMVVGTAAVFPPGWALAYILMGIVASATVNYYMGRLFGRDLVRRFPGGRLNRLSKRLAKRGLWAVIVVRNIPVAPYAVINIVAGASHIRMRDYLAGTALGMLPGLLAITFFTDRLTEALLHPETANVVLALVLGIVLFAGLYLLRRRLKRRDASSAEQS